MEYQPTSTIFSFLDNFAIHTCAESKGNIDNTYNCVGTGIIRYFS